MQTEQTEHTTTRPSQELARALRSAMERFATDPKGAISDLEPLYHPDIVFEDPMQRLHGKQAFLDMNHRLVRRSRSIDFAVSETIVQGDAIVLVWTIIMKPRLAPRLTVPGVSHIRAEGGRVRYHRDYFDLLSGAAEALPLFSTVYRRLSKKA